MDSYHMPTQTKHSLLETLHMYLQVKVTAAVILNCLPYTHMGSPTPTPKFLSHALAWNTLPTVLSLTG